MARPLFSVFLCGGKEKRKKAVWPRETKVSGCDSLAWPDRFFPFFFVVAEKMVW